MPVEPQMHMCTVTLCVGFACHLTAVCPHTLMNTYLEFLNNPNTERCLLITDGFQGPNPPRSCMYLCLQTVNLLSPHVAMVQHT